MLTNNAAREDLGTIDSYGGLQCGCANVKSAEVTGNGSHGLSAGRGKERTGYGEVSDSGTIGKWLGERRHADTFTKGRLCTFG